MHSKRIPKFSKTFTGIFTVPFSFGLEISEILVEMESVPSLKVRVHMNVVPRSTMSTNSETEN